MGISARLAEEMTFATADYKQRRGRSRTDSHGGSYWGRNVRKSVRAV